MSNKSIFLILIFSFFIAAQGIAQNSTENPTLSWSAVSGAREYEVEVENEQRRLVYQRRTTQTNLTVDLAEGSYRFRVRVYDRFGRTAVGPWRDFTVQRNEPELPPARILRVEPGSVVSGGVVRGVVVRVENGQPEDQIILDGADSLKPLSVLKNGNAWELVLDLTDAIPGPYTLQLSRDGELVESDVRLQILPIALTENTPETSVSTTTETTVSTEPISVPDSGSAFSVLPLEDRRSQAIRLPLRLTAAMPLLLPGRPDSLPPEEPVPVIEEAPIEEPVGVNLTDEPIPTVNPEVPSPMLMQNSLSLGWSYFYPVGWLASVASQSFIGGKLTFRSDGSAFATPVGAWGGFGIEGVYQLLDFSGSTVAGSKLHWAQGTLQFYLRTPWPEPLAFFAVGGVGIAASFYATESAAGNLSTDPLLSAGGFLRGSLEGFSLEAGAQYEWFFFVTEPSMGIRASLSLGWVWD